MCLIGFEIMVEDVSMDKYSVDPCYSGADDSAQTSFLTKKNFGIFFLIGKI